MPSELLTRQEDQTLILTLSDPATRNSLSPQAVAAAVEALDRADGDPGIRAVIMRGDGAQIDEIIRVHIEDDLGGKFVQ